MAATSPLANAGPNSSSMNELTWSAAFTVVLVVAGGWVVDVVIEVEVVTGADVSAVVAAVVEVEAAWSGSLSGSDELMKTKTEMSTKTAPTLMSRAPVVF